MPGFKQDLLLLSSENFNLFSKIKKSKDKN
jgi:hypothetical protein